MRFIFYLVGRLSLIGILQMVGMGQGRTQIAFSPMPSICGSITADEFETLLCSKTMPYDAVVAIGISPNVAERKRFAMEILNSSVDSSAWENAVLIQGILGWSENRLELMELVTRQEEATPVSPPVFRAKLQSLVSLGILFKNSKDPQACSDISRFFMKLLDDPDWIGKLRWESPFHQDKVELYVDLLAAAIKGMGHSGDKLLLTALFDFRDRHSLMLKNSPSKQEFDVGHRRRYETGNAQAPITTAIKSSQLIMRESMVYLINVADDGTRGGIYLQSHSLSEYFQYIFQNGDEPGSKLQPRPNWIPTTDVTQAEKPMLKELKKQ